MVQGRKEIATSVRSTPWRVGEKNPTGIVPVGSQERRRSKKSLSSFYY